MKIAFSGTQRGMTQAQYRVLRLLLDAEQRDEFHHGDCVKSDADAATMAASIGHRTIAHPPLDSKKRAHHKSDVVLEPLDYMVRNAALALVSDILFATPGQAEEVIRSGTWMTIRTMRRLKKPVIIIFPDGSVRREG